MMKANSLKTIKVFHEDWKFLKRLKDDRDDKKVADTVANLLKSLKKDQRKVNNDDKGK